MSAPKVVIQVHAGVEKLWCSECNRQARVRVYAFTEQSIHLVGSICEACYLDKKLRERQR